eukprot:CAMPEP_0174820962 /NCGR_PEP_ID=MMETSP1107-20130205/5124_1 /TAXON_ID=36770 /ORGANISM="Paraphysomonas vestita, Strain GFlagA" /LENGTH=152 /DNA_ID=CAMNT_0016037309 /DNA_START=69 /DNA_END=527 /DNA_ORIENTATION=+
MEIVPILDDENKENNNENKENKEKNNEKEDKENEIQINQQRILNEILEEEVSDDSMSWDLNFGERFWEVKSELDPIDYDPGLISDDSSSIQSSSISKSKKESKNRIQKSENKNMEEGNNKNDKDYNEGDNFIQSFEDNEEISDEENIINIHK